MVRPEGLAAIKVKSAAMPVCHVVVDKIFDEKN
jgi:hypothetical protein